MKTLSKFFFLLFLILPSQLFSQNAKQGFVGLNITGKVIDFQTESAIDYASVAVYPSVRGNALTGTLTNNQGKFFLKGIAGGNLIIKIECMGYDSQSIPISLKEDNLEMMVIKLKPSPMVLSSVTVGGKIAERTVTLEKSRINVDKSTASTTGNLLEIIKSQPSVTVDNDNNLYIRGNKNILILIDGKPTTLSSISEIPSLNISHLEIITSPNVKYDADGSGGIVNIVSKARNSEGKSMMATLNGGLNNRFNGGFGLNYNNGRWGIDAGYSTRYELENIHSNLDRELFTPYSLINQIVSSERKTVIHSANLIFSYTPDSKNLLSLNLKGNFPTLSTNQSIYGNDAISSTTGYHRKNDITFARNTYEGTASYKRAFTKNKNELSFDLAFSGTKGNRPAYYYIGNILNQRSEGGGRPTNTSLQSDYLKVFNSGLKLESGAKFFSRWNSFKYRFYDINQIDHSWILNPEFSNDLKHKEYIYSIYTNLSGKFSSSFQYSYGVRAEYSTSDFSQKTTGESFDHKILSIFPYLSLNHDFNKQSNLSFTFNRRITRPTYPQMNPFINMIDHMTYESGNKKLLPELTENGELIYSLKKEKASYKANLYINHTRDYITQITSVTDGDKLLITYINVPDYMKYGTDIEATFSLNRYISLNPILSAYYNKYYGETKDGISLNSYGYNAVGGVKINVSPDKFTDMQFSFAYYSPQHLPQLNVEEYNTADFSIKRRLLKGKLSANLNITDIFNTREWNVSTQNIFYNLRNHSKGDNRVIWLGLTMNLNSFKIRQPKKEAQNGEEGLIKLGY